MAAQVSEFLKNELTLDEQEELLSTNGEEKKQQKKSQADVLIELAQGLPLFRDDYQEPFVSVNIHGHNEIWPVRSKFFKRWLIGRFYYKTGKAPNSDAINQALSVIEARAMFEGPEHKLSLRVAKHDGAFWYDLADDRWRAVKITPEGWQIVNKPPILFRRYKNTAAQVEPRGKKDDLWDLLDFINLRDTGEKILLLVYVVSCLIPEIPHVIPVFYGEKGAAKSTTLRLLRRVIDPARQELLTLPTDKNELALQLAHNYMPAYDNLDNLQPWQSDMLCCAATGGGISKRELYTDEDEVILSFLRCVGINGINVVATRPDLLDRTLMFGLERISSKTRREESEFWQEFEQARPGIVAGAFHTLAEAMRIYPDVKLTNLPRMADFCRWGYAIAEAFGVGGKSFLKAYYKNMGKTNEEAISNNPVTSAVVIFMQERDEWQGTAAQLLRALKEIAENEQINTRSKSWPGAPQILTRRLKQVKSNLMDIGIRCTIDRDKSNRSVVTFQKVKESTSETSGTSESIKTQGVAGRRYLRRYSGDTSGTSGVFPVPEANSYKPSGATGDTGDTSANSWVGEVGKN